MKTFNLRPWIYAILERAGLALMDFGELYGNSQGFIAHHDGTFTVREPISSVYRTPEELKTRLESLFLPLGFTFVVKSLGQDSWENAKGELHPFVFARFSLEFKESIAGELIPDKRPDSAMEYQWDSGDWV